MPGQGDDGTGLKARPVGPRRRWLARQSGTHAPDQRRNGALPPGWLSAPRVAGACLGAWLLCHAATLIAPAAVADDASSRPASALLCPVTGQPADRGICARFRGRFVYFASDAARQQFEREPARFAEQVQSQWTADPLLRVQVRCPVTGEPARGTVYEGCGDDAVFFASEEARRKWLADPAAYRDRLERECYTFQTGCATCGNPINPAAVKTVDGRALYFCCTGCPMGFERDREKHLRAVDAQIASNKAEWERRSAARAVGAPASQPATRPAAAPTPP